MSVPESGGSSRGRGIAAVVCVVLAALLLTPAAVAYWGQRTLNDTERYVDTVGPLVQSPEVQDVIATRVTDALEAQVDTEALIHQAFAGDQLVGPQDQQGQQRALATGPDNDRLAFVADDFKGSEQAELHQ